MIHGRPTTEIALDDARTTLDRACRFREMGTSIGRWTRQDPAGYVDGPNRYQYEESSSITSADPNGLDRYINEDGLHLGIAVDTWEYVEEDDLWRRTGQITFDFSVDWNSGWWFLGGIAWKGNVLESPGIALDGDYETYPTRPEDDIAMTEMCRYLAGNPPIYSVVGYSCRRFVEDMIWYGENGYQDLDHGGVTASGWPDPLGQVNGEYPYNDTRRPSPTP